jgi:hypothetical protein
MATTLSSLETVVRRDLKEASASFWSQAELLQHFNDGIQNLWGAIIDLFEEHYVTVDETNVSLAAEGTQLTGVPADTFRVHLIEPRDTTSAGTAPSTIFIPKEYNGTEFANARAMTSVTPGSGVKIFYQVTGPGYPVSTPVVRTAPKLSSALNLRFVYVPGIPVKVIGDDNPIPGQSDRALHAYCMAFALAKEQEDKMPHPGWLQVFSTEKNSVLQRLTPRQTQEVQVVEDLFGAYFETDGYL